TLVGSEVSPERVFMAVSEETARVLEVSASAVFRYEGDDTATVVGRHDRNNVGAFALGERIAVDQTMTIGRVLYTGAPARIDDYSSLPGEVPKLMMRIGYRSTVSAPIVVAGLLRAGVARSGADPWPPAI